MRFPFSFHELVAPAAAQEQAAATGGAAQLIGVVRAQVSEISGRLDATRQELADLPGYALQALNFLTDLEGLPALGRALLVLVAVAALGGAAHWLLDRGLGHLRARMTQLSGAKRAAALPVILILDLIGIFVFLAVANGASFLFLARFDPRRELVVAVLLAITIAQVAGSISRAILAPSAPSQRLVPLDDRVARDLHLWIVGTAGFVGFGFFGGGLLGILAIPPELVALWDIAFASLLGLLIVAWVWLYRQPVAAAFGGEGLAQSWHVAATVYVGVFWFVWSYQRFMQDTHGARIVLLSGLVLVAVPIIERAVRALIGRLLAPWPGQDADTHARLARTERVVLIIVRVLLVIAAVGLVVETWGGPVLSALRTDMGRVVMRAVFNVGVAVLLGYAAWEGSKILIERHVGRPQPGEELQPGTRAHTLLPVLRHFALGALSVVIGLIVLSSVGVDIGPLLAGAGIVGLAIGFGAQTLVRDIVAGFFFLLDDAFRIGEYVDVGRVKGTVEGITIRSLQLRHHRGALHTIPYGQIQAISNHHRDWVIEKLEFGLVYGTDIEKVRKILKKVGEAMMQDPEIAAVLLEPLKSQGVSRLADSSMVFRAKFKAVPGQQFLVRREAYRRIQDAFAANGIEFAYPMVKIAGPEGVAAPEAAAAARKLGAEQAANSGN